MENTETQGVVNPKDQLKDRMKTRFADRNFDGLDGSDGSSSLEQSILEAMDEDSNTISSLNEKQKVYEENTSRITSLFNNSPRASVFLNTLAATGDPGAAIHKAYGKDAYDAFVQGDASSVIAEIEAEDARVREEDAAFRAEKEANLQESFDALDKWGDEKGLDEDQKVSVFMRFYDILSDALVGKYSPELFEMGWKADHYDADVESARTEGEVAGRNAKIQEMSRRRQSAAAMPPALTGQGVRQPEAKPAKEEDNPWML